MSCCKQTSQELYWGGFPRSWTNWKQEGVRSRSQWDHIHYQPKSRDAGPSLLLKVERESLLYAWSFSSLRPRANVRYKAIKQAANYFNDGTSSTTAAALACNATERNPDKVVIMRVTEWLTGWTKRQVLGPLAITQQAKQKQKSSAVCIIPNWKKSKLLPSTIATDWITP